MTTSRRSPDTHHVAAGGVELREDLPLKASGTAGAGGAGGGVRCCAGGPRLILAAFAALTAAITLALLTQIYCGDYEVVPHGSVSSSAAACSRAGTDALKAGGGALDAAVAAALCLAVLAPHRTSLDASGAMLYWEYRSARTQPPVLFEWGAAGSVTGGADAGGEAGRPPRLVAALAALHAELGTLPWRTLLQPAIQLASGGFVVSEGLSSAAAGAGEEAAAAYPLGANITAPLIAAYFTTLQRNTSAELSATWGSGALVRRGAALEQCAGGWRVVAGGGGAAPALHALAAALQPPPVSSDDAQRRAISSLQAWAGVRAGGAGVATGLAAVDQRDTYVALVTGLSVAFGSGPVTAAGWRRDSVSGAVPLDLSPAFLLDDHVCGTRYVLGGESSSALAQGGAALVAEGAGGVERARVDVLPGGALAREARRPPPAPAALPALAPPVLNASLPYAALNLVQQRADALASHADSRGGGLASRF